MKARSTVRLLCLALLFAGACGGSSTKDTGTDPGIDTPIPTDAAGDEGLAGEVEDAAEDRLPPQDLPVETLDAEIADDVAEDPSPEADADLPPEDEGGGELPGEVVDEDAADAADAEAGDTCEGPECVPCEDDGLECTDSARDEMGNCIVVLKEGFCLIDDACVEKDVRDPSNPCLTCQPETDTGAYVVAVGLDCPDPTPCSLGGICTAEATCVTAVKPCEDFNACTFDYCVDGVCEHPIVASGTCDDGNKCTYSDRCDNGVCKGTPKSCPSDNNVCTDDGCEPATGNCTYTPNSAACDDHDWCTQGDACLAGQCKGTARNCADTDPCSRDECIDGLGDADGTCKHTPIPGQPCEDGDLCTTNDMCGQDLVCRPGGARVCNDNNACTDDSCDPAVGCVYAPHTRPCDDQDPCTVNDTCSPSGCHGTPRPCDDANPCTTDTCNYGVCLNLAVTNNTPCDDANECTTGDRCVNSYCVPTGTKDCGDGNACTLDACQLGVGCTHSPLDCDDGNPCTTDSCDSATGCLHVANALACNDGDPCTVEDKCMATVCVGAPMNCQDGDPCTFDVCEGGICQHPANLGACDDGNACTDGEKCVNGQCTGGKEVLCNDANDCTTDMCSPSTGCVFTPVPTQPCDDHTVCTTGDQCTNGVCTGNPINCSDGNFCTDDLCDPVGGCYWENNDLLCNDGNACTILDQCAHAVCAGVNMFANPLTKAATLNFTTHGTPGHGLDVDGNPATCSPANDCSDGIDNLFGKMGIYLYDDMALDLAAMVADGRLALLLEHEAPGPGAGPYDLNVFFGRRTDPTSCNPATSGCNYLAYGNDLIGNCTPKYILPNATIVGDTLTAGGKEYEAVVYFVFGSVMLPETLKWARVQATVTRDAQGRVTGGSGVLAGAFDVKQLKRDIDTIQDNNQFSPYSRDYWIQQLDFRLCSSGICGDIDTDRNGTLDSASIGLPFTIVTGNGVGRY